jgi:CMP-N-acetylneuraminic acid synthetase
LAIILGRAGSKGVPGKNTMPIAGRPCAAWTIDLALAAKSVGAIVVSTDDPSLLRLAKDMGVHAIERSPDLATDRATVDAAAREAVTKWEGPTPHPSHTPIVILYANVPIRPAGLIDRAVSRMLKTGCDSVQSYAPVGKMHPWWTARIDSDTGHVRPWEGEVLNNNTYRRQDLPPAFIPDGGVLVMTRRALFCEIPGVPPGPHACFGKDRRGVTTREGEVVDIDSPMDAIVADTILKSRSTAREGATA